MFIKRLIPNFIKQFIFRILIKLKYPKIKIGKNCKLDKSTIYEGYNTLQENVKIGKSYLGTGTYIATDSVILGAKIGRFCAIGGNVRTGIGLHPSKDFVSISPSFYSLNSQNGLKFAKTQLFEEHNYIDLEKKYFCEIGNDVWIGNNVMVMDGVKIGDGAIVAGGAIVTKNVEPYTIVGGIPAKQIKKRFTNEQIEKLLKIKWWEWEIERIKEKSNLFADITKFLEHN